MSRWTEFHARHGERKYTPVFNSFLDAMIRDEEAPLSERVWAWVIRRSWGNHSDSCVDADGIIQTQVDCARELGIKDKTGEANRRIVNPVFQEFERRNFVRFEGREIFPIDDPSADPMAETLEKALEVLPLSDSSRTGGESKIFHRFIEQVWGKQHPDEYLRYQRVGREWKEIRTSILSASGKPFSECPKGAGQTEIPVSERGRTKCPRGHDKRRAHPYRG